MVRALRIYSITCYTPSSGVTGLDIAPLVLLYLVTGKKPMFSQLQENRN